tara:strand:- start:60306 stop:61937 length:1632 start_codon:yes stop_codon:yes gene_type:complete
MSNNKCAPVAVGEMTFVQAKLPPLEDGDYKVSVKQTIISPKVAENTFNADLIVSVKGPRFALSPADIHSVFPPAKHQGTFGSTIPNIVITRTTLPWERMLNPADSVNPKASTPPPPWVALLVFDKSDFPNPPPSNPSGSNNVVGKINGGSVADLFALNGLPQFPKAGKLPSGTLGPTIIAEGTPKRKLDLWESPSDQCNFIDLPVDLFTAIVPYCNTQCGTSPENPIDELSLLAHIRNINTDNKIIDGLTGDGCYAVVVGNRFPKNPTSGPTGIESTACLVSLEGFQGYLNATPSFAANTKYVRMAVLANWQFVNNGPDDIGDLMEELDVGMLNMTGNTPIVNTPPTVTEATASDFVEFAFNAGYAALNHQTRVGEHTVSWYRGPFSPFNIPLIGPNSENNYMNYTSSDQALRYNLKSGLFDISYAAAWQLGKLLALQNRYFASAVYNYKNSATKNANFLMNQMNLQNQFKTILNFPADKHDLMDHNLFTELTLDWLDKELLPQIAHKNKWETKKKVVAEKEIIIEEEKQVKPKPDKKNPNTK